MGANKDSKPGAMVNGVNVTGIKKAFAGSNGNNSIDDYCWYGEFHGKPQAVGSKTANELGLFDMSGNALEWCWDWYSSDFPNDHNSDYKGPETGTAHTMHGGSFNLGATPLSVSYRYSYPPYFTTSIFGFRVVRP